MSLRIIYSAQRGTTLIIARVLLILVTLSRDCNGRASEQNMPSGEHERVGRDHRSVSEVRLVFEGSRTTSPDQRGNEEIIEAYQHLFIIILNKFALDQPDFKFAI